MRANALERREEKTEETKVVLEMTADFFLSRNFVFLISHDKGREKQQNFRITRQMK